MGVQDRLKVALTRSPRLYDLARRPYALARFAARRPHDADYRAFGLFGREGTFLDVGANAGMSALSFRVFRRRDPIVSIEPNPFHERDLRFAGRVVRRFDYRMWAAGSQDTTLELHVPVFRGVPLTTEASLHHASVVGSTSLRARLGDRMDSADFAVVAREVPVRRLDALGLSPAFLKLDTQGSEHAALVGLEASLERGRPVVMVESAGGDVHALLGELGYEACAYDAAAHRLTWDRGGEVNTFFVAGADRQVVSSDERTPAPRPLR